MKQESERDGRNGRELEETKETGREGNREGRQGDRVRRSEKEGERTRTLAHAHGRGTTRRNSAVPRNLPPAHAPAPLSCLRAHSCTSRTCASAPSLASVDHLRAISPPLLLAFRSFEDKTGKREPQSVSFRNSISHATEVPEGMRRHAERGSEALFEALSTPLLRDLYCHVAALELAMPLPQKRPRKVVRKE